jgi:hypothetical protein
VVQVSTANSHFVCVRVNDIDESGDKAEAQGGKKQTSQPKSKLETAGTN